MNMKPLFIAYNIIFKINLINDKKETQILLCVSFSIIKVINFYKNKIYFYIFLLKNILTKIYLV